MERSSNCLYPSIHNVCPIGAVSCAGCPWDAEENERRRKIPLTRDELTGLRRKIVREKVGTDGV